MKHTKFLFLTKEIVEYGQEGVPHGLINSVKFIIKKLEQLNILSNHISITDNSLIDSHIAQHKPENVIIEALWLSPHEIHELSLKHPNVNFIVRLHSDTPFLASETDCVSYIRGYLRYKHRGSKISIASNDESLVDSFRGIFGKHSIEYMPDIYDI
jgi:hypothetical protein